MLASVSQLHYTERGLSTSTEKGHTKQLLLCLLTGSLCCAEEPSWDFLCQGPSVWTNSLKYYTTADRVQFVGPLDRTYGNDCEAEVTNAFNLLVDSINHSIELRVDSKPATVACPRFYAPVSAMSAEFGPLAAGDWVFWSSAYKFTNFFTVYPDPGPVRLRTSFESAIVRVEWPAVAYLHYELETSATLTNWQKAQMTYTFDESMMSAVIQHDAPHKFFRLKRSSISNGVTYLPGGCP